MKDENRSKRQLIDELVNLREQVAGLKGSENDFMAFNSLADPAYLTDSDFQVISFNDRFRMWGEEIGLGTDVIGRDLLKAFPFLSKEALDQYRQVLNGEKALVTGETFTVGGRDYFTETRKIPVMKGGYVAGVITVIKDVTTRKEAEEALRKAEQKYRAIYENAVEGIFQTTIDGRYISANPALARMFGYSSPEEMMGLVNDIGRQQYADPEDRATLQRLYEENDHVEGFETQFYTKDRSKVWISINGRAGRSTDGQVLYYEGTAEDITDRKKAEEQLYQERETFFSILHNAPYGIFLHDPAGNLLFLNAEATHITGYAMEDIPKGRTWFAKAYPDPKYGKLVIDTWKYRVSPKSIDRTFTVRCKDGTSKDIEFRSFKLMDGKAVTMFQDVTQRRLAEAELRKSREELRTLTAHIQSVREKERTRIAREIHDELGQALTCIKMDLSEIKEECGPASDRNTLLSKTRSLLELVDSTIDVVRRIAADLRPSILDDLGLVAAVQWLVQDYRKRTGIRCGLKAPDSILIPKDMATAVFRILQESLTNVTRHAKADKVEITLRKKKGTLTLKVKDNGKGIIESEISNPRSFGILGMRERVLLFQGKIDITGTSGKGTTVMVEIPFTRKTGKIMRGVENTYDQSVDCR
ncbi:MAG: Oxygen sensor histidine kinase NreB [Syntrophorhabdaceae bacterium PtaU1.Bin034]|nr:MAG: Oxygen sensor histidine kinase NreB [Syntrophorhabdaceae bacterium PtaU1.Bin034]